MKYHMSLLISSCFVSSAGSIGCMEDSDRGDSIPSNAQHVQVQAVDDATALRFQAGFTVPQRLDIHDASTWTRIWPQIAGSATPLLPVPAIDFSSTTVIIAAMGTKATGGYEIRVDDAATLGADAWISVVERSPGAHCVVPDVVTSPAAVVALPRFDGGATFVEHTEATICE